MKTSFLIKIIMFLGTGLLIKYKKLRYKKTIFEDLKSVEHVIDDL
jgi:hypothetical protein